MVPLALRNLLADKRRLLRSISGISFAVLLMLLQLGFQSAFLDSSLAIVQRIDGDIIISSAAKFRFGRKEPFSFRQIHAARAVDGVEWVRPIYGEWLTSAWKNPQTGKTFNVQVLGFDPLQPVFSFPEVAGRTRELQQPNTAMFDNRARKFLGAADNGLFTELARREIQVVGTFSLGPDFTTDGTVILSDWNFRKFFPPLQSSVGTFNDVELGVIRVRPGLQVADVQRALQQKLPPSVVVRTKAEMIALEAGFQNGVSPVGYVFGLGTAIGFLVGLMISYQILYTDLSDQLPQYATLKAMGYRDSYLIRSILGQACLYGVAGFLSAWAASLVIFRIIEEVTLLPMNLSVSIVLKTVSLTVGMCLLSGFLAVQRVLRADPAEVFK